MKKKFRVIQLKRKNQGRTDYKTRLKLLKSGKIRVVVRRSLKNIYIQFIQFHPKGDKVLVAANSKELEKKYNWKYYGGNMPSAYLVGFLAGIKAKKKGIKEAVLDIGVSYAHKKGILYSVLKGLIDSEIKIPYKKEILPDEKRIRGAHIVDYAKKLAKENQEKYKTHFSNYLKNKVDVEKITDDFDRIKEKILKEK